MKWLITGGCGFIGTNLITELVNNNEEVYIIDNMSTSSQDNVDYLKNLPVNIIEADILEPQNFKGLDVDVIVHLAAHAGVLPSFKKPRFDCNTNILGTINVLEHAAKTKANVIFASSGAVLGEKDPPVEEAMRPEPNSPYGVSKMAAEAYCKVYQKHYNIPVAVLRFSNVYGPCSRGKDSVIAKFIKTSHENKPLSVYGSGEQTRDFIYIADLVDAIIRTFENNLNGTFHVGSGKETSILEIAKIISNNIVHENAKPEITRNYVNINKICAALDWKPTTPLREGIRKTIEWFYPAKTMIAGNKKRKVWVVSYATPDFAGGQLFLNLSAAKFGLHSMSYNPDFIKKTKYYQDNRAIFSNKKGAGFWIWKPYIIKHALSKIGPDDVLIYVDTDFHFIKDPKPLIEECLKTGVGLYINRYINSTWTKRDCFVIMGCDEPEYYNVNMTLGGMHCWAKTDISMKILNEWLKYAQDSRISTRDPENVLGKPNLPDFKRHSTDQSILTNLAIKYNVERFMPPAKPLCNENLAFYYKHNLIRPENQILIRHGRFDINKARQLLAQPKVWQNHRELFVKKPPRKDVFFRTNPLFGVDKYENIT